VSERDAEAPGTATAAPGILASFWDEALPDRRTEPLTVTGQRMDMITPRTQQSG
jgi:hypothetical protein